VRSEPRPRVSLRSSGLRSLPRLSLPARGHKYNFNPAQSRIPAGNPEGGQWTGDGSGAGRTNSVTDAVDNDWQSGARYAAGPRLPRGPKDGPISLPLHIPMPGAGSTYRAGQVTIVNNAQTGLSTVDETTEKLRDILEKVVNSRGEGYGSKYGTAIHKDFADAVRDENLKGVGRVGVEQTYGPDPNDPYPHYGSKGSIRTDITLRNDGGEPIAIYDVKTGDAALSAARVQELRGRVNASVKIPVIEMHILRGLSLKGKAEHKGYFWIITLRLWRP
jgi:hypothetical protein